MPFTLSHPAAVLPLLRSPMCAVALTAGAVAPDLPYFARSVGITVTAQSWYEPFLNATTAHSWRGMVTVDLAYAAALSLLAWAARRPVETLLAIPGRTERSRPARPREHLRRGWWVLASLLIGIATHLGWDSFTHGDGYVVDHVAWLRSPLAGGLTWARALQHASTVGGLAAIAVYGWRRRSRLTNPRTSDPAPMDRRLRLGLLGAAGAVIAAAGVANISSGWSSRQGLTTGRAVESVLSDGAKGAGAALVGVLVGYAAAWWLVRGWQAWRADPLRARAEPPRTELS